MCVSSDTYIQTLSSVNILAFINIYDLLNNERTSLYCTVLYSTLLYLQKASQTYRGKNKAGKLIEKGIAFPVCVSVNECVCHCSPLASDETVRSFLLFFSSFPLYLFSYSSSLILLHLFFHSSTLSLVLLRFFFTFCMIIIT